MTYPLPDNRQAIADALRDRVALLNEQQQRLQAAIETFVQDCVAAMELDTESGAGEAAESIGDAMHNVPDDRQFLFDAAIGRYQERP